MCRQVAICEFACWLRGLTPMRTSYFKYRVTKYEYISNLGDSLCYLFQSDVYLLRESDLTFFFINLRNRLPKRYIGLFVCPRFLKYMFYRTCRCFCKCLQTCLFKSFIHVWSIRCFVYVLYAQCVLTYVSSFKNDLYNVSIIFPDVLYRVHVYFYGRCQLA